MRFSIIPSSLPAAIAACLLLAANSAVANGYSVDAGPDQIVNVNEPVRLTGSLTDAQEPIATVGWTVVEGPGDVRFTSPRTESTEAEFTAPGEYVLSLAAYDGYIAYDFVRVTVR